MMLSRSTGGRRIAQAGVGAGTQQPQIVGDLMDVERRRADGGGYVREIVMNCGVNAVFGDAEGAVLFGVQGGDDFRAKAGFVLMPVPMALPPLPSSERVGGGFRRSAARATAWA